MALFEINMVQKFNLQFNPQGNIIIIIKYFFCKVNLLHLSKNDPKSILEENIPEWYTLVMITMNVPNQFYPKNAKEKKIPKHSQHSLSIFSLRFPSSLIH